MARLSWQQLRAEFLQGAEDYPNLSAHWDSRQDIWTFRTDPRGESAKPPDPNAERRFKETARIAGARLGSSEAVALWRAWLDRMREQKRGFQRYLQFRTWRETLAFLEAEGPTDTSRIPLSQDAGITHVFEESADFCADLDALPAENHSLITSNRDNPTEIAMGASITNTNWWTNLEKRFQALANEFGDQVTANWTSTTWNPQGHHWNLGGPEGRERAEFVRLAERAAVGLGHLPGEGALFFWLDQLKNKGFNFIGGYQGTDSEGTVSQQGKIRRPSEASANYCFTLATIGLSSKPVDAIDSPPSKYSSGSDSGQRLQADEPMDTVAHRPPESSEARSVADVAKAVSSWQEIEIIFLSDERVQITAGNDRKTLNYAEFGFQDGRNEKPNLAWTTLRELARLGGNIERSDDATGWVSVEKRAQEIRKVFRNYFSLADDPLPFVENVGYRACFKIRLARSFNH